MYKEYPKPYLSDGPLTEKTPWVGFPLLLIGAARNYHVSLQKAKELEQNLFAYAQSFVLKNAKIVTTMTDVDETLFRTNVELSQRKPQEFMTSIYLNVVLAFEQEADLWDKVANVGHCLDKFVSLCEHHKSDKWARIELGVQFLNHKRGR